MYNKYNSNSEEEIRLTRKGGGGIKGRRRKNNNNKKKREKKKSWMSTEKMNLSEIKLIFFPLSPPPMELVECYFLKCVPQ